MYSIEKLLKDYNYLLIIAVIGVVVFVAKSIMNNMNLDGLRKTLKDILMSLPRPIMMILMAIPEQIVLYYMQPNMDLTKRLSVSIAMYVIHFAYNGMVMKPKRSYNELVWIIGTALYARQILKVKQSTMISLLAADSIMTLALRGL